ncbi:MAG TPA: helix-turn-helix domain-containing protein [Gemmataceae bacterium]|nr:helix-turn-helix domain-containing protein [Pirellulales bacterium]HZZ79296.1 helix-turn-helix domain-containing protein [Gemmataceae bacterium]
MSKSPDSTATTPLLTAKQAAARLNVSTTTIYALCNSGRLPHYRFGVGRGTLRFRQDDLEVFVEMSYVEPGVNKLPVTARRRQPSLKGLKLLADCVQ